MHTPAQTPARAAAHITHQEAEAAIGTPDEAPAARRAAMASRAARLPAMAAAWDRAATRATRRAMGL